MRVLKYGGTSVAGAVAPPGSVVVHGGGPQIDAELAVRGIGRAVVRGLRVTTPETLAVVREVLARVNAELAAALGGTRVDGETVFTAVQADPVLGLVGEVVAVDTAPVLAAVRTPVVSCLAPGYNVNADLAAAALAAALRAEELVLLTDVPGLLRDGRVVGTLDVEAAEKLLPELDGGIVPKLDACLRAVRGGVPLARITNRLDAPGTAVTP